MRFIASGVRRASMLPNSPREFFGGTTAAFGRGGTKTLLGGSIDGLRAGARPQNPHPASPVVGFPERTSGQLAQPAIDACADAGTMMKASAADGNRKGRE